MLEIDGHRVVRSLGHLGDVNRALKNKAILQASR
jgi:hypothetical protein